MHFVILRAPGFATPVLTFWVSATFKRYERGYKPRPAPNLEEFDRSQQNVKCLFMKIIMTKTSISIWVATLFVLTFLSAWIVWMQMSRVENDSDRLRGAAMASFQSGRYQEALANIKLAIDAARRLPASSVQVVEAYDDAGLYFFTLGDFRQSVRHQAIAVLFASENPELRPMLPVYVERLGWAWEKYRPGSDFSLIKANPPCLLADRYLALFDETRIREHFHKQEEFSKPCIGNEHDTQPRNRS